ncbi:Ionotropic receptor 211 [Blattella germanica]|nr:Ionotropic receptor 211 [Blattella germanica]
MLLLYFIIAFGGVLASDENLIHIVECLHDVLVKNFETKDSIVISTNVIDPTVKPFSNPLDGSSFLSLILSDIHYLQEWPLFVTSISHDTKIGPRTNNQDGYILLLEGNEDELVSQLELQISLLQNSKDWNPRGKFIIVLLETIENPEESVIAVFSELWKSKIANVVVLLHTKEVSCSSNTNNNEQFLLYTWFPYSPPDNCGNFIDAILINCWIMENEFSGNFINNSSLFPEKIPRKFHGCPLVASAFELGPVVLKSDPNGEYDEGIEVRLFLEFARFSNMSAKFLGPPPGEYWGIRLDNGTWTGNTGQVYRCHVLDEFECLYPHIIDPLRWFVPCAVPFPRWTSLTRVFKLSLWLGFLASYVVISLFMFLTVKISMFISTHPLENDAYNGLVKCMLNFWAVILEESASNFPPPVLVIRTVFLMWVLYCYAVNSVYQTFLTSFLIDPGLQHQISTEDEVLTCGLEFGIHPTVTAVFHELDEGRYKGHISCNNFKECHERIALQRDLSLFFPTLPLEYIIFVKFLDSEGKPLICKLDEVYVNALVSFPVLKGYPMLFAHNNVIQRLSEGGILNLWWNNIKYSAALSSSRNREVVNSEYITLSLKHLQSAFYALFLGYLLSCFSFCVEYFYSKTKAYFSSNTLRLRK